MSELQLHSIRLLQGFYVQGMMKIVLITVQSPAAKQDDAAASMTFSTMFGSVANCVINVNVGGQAPEQLNTHCVLCMLFAAVQLS